MRSKCIIPRCKTVIYCYGSTFEFPIWFLRRISRANLPLYLTYLTSWCYSVDKRILLEKTPSLCVEITKYKQLVYTFLHFVASLKCRFYTLTLIFVSEVNIYPYSLRLLKVDPVVSRLLATNRQYSILALSLLLHWLLVTLV